MIAHVLFALALTPTFAADVAPIIYNNCSTCHRPGQAAPFSLLSYDDVERTVLAPAGDVGGRLAVDLEANTGAHHVCDRVDDHLGLGS